MPLKNGNESNEIVRVPEEVTGLPRRLVAGKLMLRQTFSALRHRNFRLFFSGQLVSLIGTWLQNTAQGWLVWRLTGSQWMLGLVTAVSTAPMLFFSVWGGSMADRHSKRNIVLSTQVSMMVLALTFAALVWSGKIKIWEILVVAGLRGLTMAFDMPARQAFMVEMTSREDLMNAISLNSSMVNSARVIGPSIAGILIVRVGMAMCFFLDGLSYLAVIASLLMMRLPEFVKPKRSGSAGAHVMEGFSYVWRHRRMKTLLMLFAVVGIFGWSYSVLLPAFATDVLKTGAAGYGELLSANGIGALLGALTVTAVSHRASLIRMLAFGGLWIFSAMLFLLAFVDNFYIALVLLAIGGWGMMLFFSTTNMVLQISSSDEMRGRVMGIWALIFGGMMPIGGLEAGSLSHWLGVRWTIAIGAMVCAAAALVTWLVVRTRQAKEEGRMQNAE
jgi:predicted MFS family arabinose efflux permease